MLFLFGLVKKCCSH